jgi:hypothetical protein
MYSNLEEPALFNEMVERFIALVEANRWRPPRSAVGVGLNVIPGQPAGLNPESIHPRNLRLNRFRVRATRAPE